MYKITLWDQNIGGCCSGIVSFFVDEIAEFEDEWLNSKYVSDEKKTRYKMSKAGKLVTDYYSTSEENNIFQQDNNAKVLEEKEYILKDRELWLYNFYGWETIVYAKEVIVKYRKIKFQDTYYWVGKYRLSGVCCQDDLEGKCWTVCCTWGNPIFTELQPSYALRQKADGSLEHDCRKEIFCDDLVETFCWVTIVHSLKENKYPFDEEFLLSDETLAFLMRDIPGEVG